MKQRTPWLDCVLCAHLSYFNLEYLSHLIFILIPLWRGFYFSKDIMLSNVHTEMSPTVELSLGER